jgi:hypothetical protein
VALQGVDAHPLLRRACLADQHGALGGGLLGTRLESLDYVDSRVQSPFVLVEEYDAHCCAIVSCCCLHFV